MDMVMDITVTMARDLLMLKLRQLPLLNQVMVIMARGQLKLNPAMDTMVMDMDMAMATDTAMDTTDTMARGLLNLAMDTMAMDMVMVMVMVMVTDTMDKSIFMLLPRE